MLLFSLEVQQNLGSMLSVFELCGSKFDSRSAVISPLWIRGMSIVEKALNDPRTLMTNFHPIIRQYFIFVLGYA